jgi:hypothetical protein
MADMPTPKDLSRLALESARRHAATSKLLAAAHVYDHAVFHQLCAVEELVKVRLVSENMVAMLAPFESDPDLTVRKTLRAAVFGHEFKIPIGILLLGLQANIASLIDAIPEGLTPEKVAAIKDKNLKDLIWLVEQLEAHEHLREESIYSGLGRDGEVPEAFDWSAAYERLSRLIEQQIRFANWSVEQVMTTEDVNTAQETLAKWLAKPKGGSEVSE